MRKCFIYIVIVVLVLVGLAISRLYQDEPYLPCICLSQIIESDHLDEIKRHLDSCSLVLFDIDNTLVAPHYSIGTDQCFTHLCQQKQKEGWTITKAIDSILPLYYQIHDHIPLYVAESSIPYLLHYLTAQSIPTIMLTARSVCLKDQTIKQLKDAGISLPFTELVDEEIQVVLDVPALYTYGIIFCGNNDKGDVLFYMLDKAGYKPNKIIFIDDKYSNLASVECVCIKRKIQFIGIRYSQLDEQVVQFDPKKAEEEFKNLFGKELKEVLC